MNIITVLMLVTQEGSPDGMIVREYAKGEEYNLPASLADVFINILKVAKEVKEDAPKNVPKDAPKVAGDAPKT